jgi:hypothetical protein
MKTTLSPVASHAEVQPDRLVAGDGVRMAQRVQHA